MDDDDAEVSVKPRSAAAMAQIVRAMFLVLVPAILLLVVIAVVGLVWLSTVLFPQGVGDAAPQRTTVLSSN